MVDQAKRGGSLELLPLPAIQQRILVVRERHVMLDEDLAVLYGVPTRRLIEQVKRNIDRFPSDFMFQLTKDEAAVLRSQFAISSDGHGGRRYAPYVFKGGFSACGSRVDRVAMPARSRGSDPLCCRDPGIGMRHEGAHNHNDYHDQRSSAPRPACRRAFSSPVFRTSQ